ncbi:phosphate ABC transporter permease subunit PstC [Corynebacterium suedekumii]|uniref:Phosphate transport system permease protein n=1 Tax=Corynebacterium suedekumii TaxID=3049801 RepID=A0ABY8VLM5_9CORY|nr:phosphate ABC transporter permease subunit PstC [Corynebacterium suedekumii]WIM70539.1 phosphate ABC transporter permease subunit PstC [Corynebacterium suedekumii]
MASNRPTTEDQETRTGDPAIANSVATIGNSQQPDSTPEIKSANGSVKRPGDRVFEFLSTASATLITVIIAAIGAFLIWRAVPSLNRNVDGWLGFFTYSGAWNTSNTEAMQFGIPNLFAVTVLISVVALLIAMPIALGIAIFLSNYAPKRAVKPLGYLVDMLAAVPSIVYGLWGWQVLGPALTGLYEWIHSWGGGFFLFATYANSPSFATGRNILTGGIVLAVMILPVIAATAREVFVQTPRGQIEAALALGATRWEVVRMTVLPFGLSGYISGSMLGLGRALGETMALYMVVSPSSAFRFSLFDGGTTFATAIANAAPEFNDDIRAGAYIAAGLVLFLLTFVVNSIARAIVNKK